jgi:hypothetical protein
MPSLEQNPFADLAVLADLKAEPDPSKRLAHLYGDWSATGAGGFFDGVLTQANFVPPWPHQRPDPNDWELSLGYDHGTANPAHCLLLAMKVNSNGQCPNGYPHARGDIVVIDEISTATPEDLTRSQFQYSIEHLAQFIVDMCQRYDYSPPHGIADAAIFAHDGRSPIAEAFRRAGVYFKPSTKPPLVTRGPFVKTLMSRATSDPSARIGAPPALYFCRGTVPVLVDSLRALERSKSNPDVWENSGPDHGLDALIYRCMTRGAKTTVMPFHL